MQPIETNEHKMLSAEKGPLYLWDIWYKPHGNHKKKKI